MESLSVFHKIKVAPPSPARSVRRHESDLTGFGKAERFWIQRTVGRCMTSDCWWHHFLQEVWVYPLLILSATVTLHMNSLPNRWANNTQTNDLWAIVFQHFLLASDYHVGCFAICCSNTNTPKWTLPQFSLFPIIHWHPFLQLSRSVCLIWNECKLLPSNISQTQKKSNALKD